MKRLIIHITLLLETVCAAAQTGSLPVIPLPAYMERHEGAYDLKTGTKVFLADKALMPGMQIFNEQLAAMQCPALIPATKQEEAGLQVSRVTVPMSGSYTLSIRPKGLLIKGDEAGVFYAFQTLLQLMDAAGQSNGSFRLPCMEISDEPAFAWRGMHLDVCRHFFPPSFIKKYIDLMAIHKMNTFHWHLTEDQGWRVEIKKYPLLTSLGSWRKGTMVGPYSNQQYDSVRYGGFYTQEEVKDIVAYATARHITIVPEIEMPGHSLAAIAAYPWLSCTGKQHNVAMGWGVFEDVYCPKDSTFTFLENVLAEVMALFPGKYIHIGGDECPKTRWKACPHCQQLIREKSLKDENGLQSYFIRHIEQFVNAKGRSIIGWDEILEGGLAPKAAVMSWRGTEGGIAAAKQKHSVVMSPGKPCYFDHYQAKDTGHEPLAIGGYNPLDSVYAYNPVPATLTEAERKYILGAQGNVWTEYILNEKGVEYMAVPRMLALAEVLWTPASQKDYMDFKKRLMLHIEALDKLQVNYCKEFLKN